MKEPRPFRSIDPTQIHIDHLTTVLLNDKDGTILCNYQSLSSLAVFVADIKDDRRFWKTKDGLLIPPKSYSRSSVPKKYFKKYFYATGVLVGRAIVDGFLLDLPFTPYVLENLLNATDDKITKNLLAAHPLYQFLSGFREVVKDSWFDVRANITPGMLQWMIRGDAGPMSFDSLSRYVKVLWNGHQQEQTDEIKKWLCNIVAAEKEEWQRILWLKLTRSPCYGGPTWIPQDYTFEVFDDDKASAETVYKVYMGRRVMRISSKHVNNQASLKEVLNDLQTQTDHNLKPYMVHTEF